MDIAPESETTQEIPLASETGSAAEPDIAMTLHEEDSVSPFADGKGGGLEEPMLDESEFALSQFDLDEPGASELDEEEPLSEILEGDQELEEDTATKLDLARAYLEMGDAEGASEFLEEVLEEGNEEQKAAAKELMEKIG